MVKAYDLKALGDKLAATGLPLAMDALEAEAGKVYVALKEWLQESAVISENKIDDIAMPFLNYIDPIVLPQIDKINGKVG
jgi:hypothetical protein